MEDEERSEARRAAKREADRLHHRTKRERKKQQIQSLEAQVTNLQHVVGTLTAQVQTLGARLQPALAGNPPPPSMASSYGVSEPPTAATVLSGTNHSSIVPDCLCGESQGGCLEYTTRSLLLSSQITDTGQLPRNPSLRHLFSPELTDNPIIQLLGLVFEQVPLANLHTLVGCYVILYRFLRWRLFPNEDTQRDVPAWLYPTELQTAVVHLTGIDFLPWPGLRDHLIRDRPTSCHYVLGYLQSILVRWPHGQDFIYTSEEGELLLTGDFEACLYRYGNWRMSREWGCAFPQLREYVNIGDEEGDLD